MEAHDTDKEYTWEEVAKHRTAGDAWTIVHGKVYDVTNYLNIHPGGVSLLLNKCGRWSVALWLTNVGRDCTDDFEGMMHSKKARVILDKYKIGVLKVPLQWLYYLQH